MKYKTIIFEIKDNIAFIKLNRPDHYNSLNELMARELLDISYECDSNKSIRCVILTGQGEKAFCSGGDLKSFYEQEENVSRHLKEVTHFLHGAITRFSRMDAPLIVAVNGVAAGAGLSFVGFADLAVCSDKASFVSAYSKAGLTPDGSSSYFLPRIIGSRRYLELVLTNKTLSSKEALEWGLINKIFEHEILYKETFKIAKELSEGPTLAFGRTKELVHNSFTSSLEGQMELETIMISKSADTEDGKEGIRSFVKKEKPTFLGK